MPKSARTTVPSLLPVLRRDHDFPAAVTHLGRRYHHIGIPTTLPRPAEKHLPAIGLHVSGFETSPFGIEWMRFDETSPLPEIIRTVPQIAFVVDDLETALAGREFLFPVGAPSGGVRTAMIPADGASVEWMEFDGRGSGEKA
ncbi:MAG: hypothetical protein JW748_09005 [Anaerolineales bacterium]|nr:hypothetical protein [Anaerolineales bacterium]